MSRAASWFGARTLEAVLGSCLILAWGYIISEQSEWSGFTKSVGLAFAAYLSFQLLSGYIITSLVLSYKYSYLSNMRFAGLFVLSFVAHFTFYCLIAGQFAFESTLILLLIGVLSVFISNYIIHGLQNPTILQLRGRA